MGTAEVDLHVGVQAIVARIAGGTMLAHPANTSLVLDASVSYDPDYQGSNPSKSLKNS